MGKSLGWHGVRLGYAATAPRRAAGLRAQLPFWNINGLAAFILKNMTRFKREYFASFAEVAADRIYMTERLAAVPGVNIYPSKANFLFVELPDSMSGRQLRDRLLENYGLMVRECSNKIGSTEQYLRLAVQGKAAVNSLVKALRCELQHFAFSQPSCKSQQRHRSAHGIDFALIDQDWVRTIVGGEKTAARSESERCTGIRLYRKATALAIKGGKLCRQNQQELK